MAVQKQYDVMYHGMKIKTGDVLKIKPWRNNMNDCYVEEVVFEWYLPEKDLYVLRYENIHGTKGASMDGNTFRRYFVGPAGKANEQIVIEHSMRMENSQLTFAQELNIDGMAIAWLWYVVLMGVTFIFNGFYLYWIFISFCFFLYRYGKLKEEGYKQ